VIKRSAGAKGRKWYTVDVDVKTCSLLAKKQLSGGEEAYWGNVLSGHEYSRYGNTGNKSAGNISPTIGFQGIAERGGKFEKFYRDKVRQAGKCRDCRRQICCLNYAVHWESGVRRINNQGGMIRWREKKSQLGHLQSVSGEGYGIKVSSIETRSQLCHGTRSTISGPDTITVAR